VQRIDAPSLSEYQHLVAKHIPFIITHDEGMQQWPAMTRWRSADYLLKVLGHRWVPVEIGQRYTDTQWQQQLMPFTTFLRDYVVVTSTTNRAVGYLAQHDLFHQVPELRRDIQIPDYCFATATSKNTVQTNAWFGPAGTTSPLHYDPDCNLFAQVVGRKQFRLYAPDQPVYPHSSDTMLHNTSQVGSLFVCLIFCCIANNEVMLIYNCRNDGNND
jgi:lysine-specific demethylase 8